VISGDLLAKRYRRVRRYARRVYGRARRSASKMTIPLAVIGGLMGAPTIQHTFNAALSGNFTEVQKGIAGLAGIRHDGQFDVNWLFANAKPIIAGVLVHKAAGVTGINRLLAKSKIPIVRV